MDETYGNQLKAFFTEERGRFKEHITRIEVHLSDKTGNKDAPDDIKCLLEATLKVQQSMVV